MIEECEKCKIEAELKEYYCEEFRERRRNQRPFCVRY